MQQNRVDNAIVEDSNERSEFERPNKRAKITLEHPEGTTVQTLQDDYEDQEEFVQKEEIRSSDLYLDTVSYVSFRVRDLTHARPDQSCCIGFRLRKSLFCLPFQCQHIRLSRLWKIFPRQRA